MPHESLLAKVIDLIGSYGPGMAPWVLLFIAVALFLLWGGKVALGNVQKLMDEGEALRLRYVSSLDSCEERLLRRDKIIAMKDEELSMKDVKIKLLQEDIDTTVNFVRSHKKQLDALESTCARLKVDLAEAVEKLELERGKRRKTDETP